MRIRYNRMDSIKLVNFSLATMFGRFVHPYMLKYQVKVKFTLEQARKAQRGSRGIALLFP
jgi:hypothetical protein